MKKKIIFAGIAGVALIAGLVWFLLGRSAKDDSYCSVIPNDAIMLGRVAPMEFLDKNNLKFEELLDRFGMDKSDRQKVEEFMQCGADLSSPIYFYLDKVSFGLTFRVDDAGSLSDYLNKKGTKLKEKDGFYLKEDNGKSIFCMDDDKALFYYSLEGDASTKDVMKLMKQDKDKSIMSTDLYKQVEESGKSLTMNMKLKDVNEWTSGYLSSEERLIYSILYPKIPDCNALMTVDAEADEMKFVIDMVPNSDQAKKDLDAMLAEYPSIQGNLMDVGLEKPVYWLCFGIPGKKLQELMDSPLLTELLPQIANEYDLPGALSSFDGDISLSIDFGGKEHEPRFLLTTKTKNNKYEGSLKTLARNLNADLDLRLVHDGGSSFRLTQSSPIDSGSSYDDDYDFDYIDEFVDDEYEDGDPVCPSTNMETIAYLSRQDDILVATNNEALSTRALPKTDALKDIREDAKGCMMYLYIDIQQMLESLDVFADLPSVDRQRMNLLKQFGHVKAYGKGAHGEMILKTVGGKNIVELAVEMLEASLRQ